MCDNVGDILTYWVIDDQTKQLLTRSVIRPFWGNKRVKWDPDFIKVPFKNTAHNGGDLKPSQEDMDQLLDTVMDRYDQEEPEPEGHDEVTEWGYNRPSVKGGSRLKEGKSTTLVDDGMNVKQPFVDSEVPDPYEGPSLLRYGNNPLEINQ